VEHSSSFWYFDYCKSFVFIFPLFSFLKLCRPVMSGGIVSYPDILPSFCRNPVENLKAASLYWACPKGKSIFKKERKTI